MSAEALKIVSIGATALELARNQVGVSEQPKGSNAGPEVERYLASVGLTKGNPWCQAFVYWVYQMAAGALRVANPVPKTGRVLSCWARAPKKLERSTFLTYPEKIQPGYQFVMKFKNGTGHTGIIERMEGFIAHTIEGNTNDDGSREGYEVARRLRHVSSFEGVIVY